MKDLATKRGEANPPGTCSAQVQAFLQTSARYLGLTPDSDTPVTLTQCLSEVPAPLACACQNAGSRLLENRL
jgi:hypothetical protein